MAMSYRSGSTKASTAIAAKASTSSPSPLGMEDKSKNGKWVNVTWMPHASLSQTSHVCLCIRSAQIRSYELVPSQPEEWQVQVTVHGIGGLPLVVVGSSTPTAPVVSSFLPSNKNPTAETKKHTTELPSTAVSKGKKQLVQWAPTISNATIACQWDFVIQMPVRWRDLPRDAFLRFQVTGKCDEVIYTTVLPFFDAYGRLQSGLKRLELLSPHSTSWSTLDKSQNPGLEPLQRHREGNSSDFQDEDPVWKASCILDQLDRFDQEPAKNNESSLTAVVGTSIKAFGDIPSVPWLDRMAKEHCQQVLLQGKDPSSNSRGSATATASEIGGLDHAGGIHLCCDWKPFSGICSKLVVAPHESSSSLHGSERTCPAYLIVELPVFDVPVMHEETFYPAPQQGASGSITPLDLALYRKRTSSFKNDSSFHPLQLVPFLDYANEHDNPVEDKYRTLTHDLLRGLVDPALKPDRVQRDRLAAIIASPSHHPTREEKDILWRFRFSLVDNRRALTKFLLAVDWTVESEVVQAAELLEQWRKRSPIEVTDALKMLGKQVAYQTNLVRAYAIDTLAAAPDEELRLYLLQLVQALKFENIQETKVNQQAGSSPNSGTVSSLAAFLVGRATKNLDLANYLYWYLKVELQDQTHGARYREVFSELQRRLSQTPFKMPVLSEPALLVESNDPESLGESGKDSRGTSFKSIVDSVSSKLGSSLRGTEQSASGSELPIRTVPKSVWDVLTSQDQFVSGVMDIQMRSRDTRGKKDAKELNLKSLLAKEGYERNPRRDPIPLPSSPEVMVNGVNPQTAKIFKSAVYPALIEFHVEGVVETHKNSSGRSSSRQKRHTTGKGSLSSSGLHHGSSYKVIVKTGDDLRQDQLVMMMIKLMDGLLKRASLDLCLTPYSVIATSPTSGLVEFVDGSIPVSQILATYNGSILQFFQSCAPQQGSKYNVRPDVISSYVRSCAGYCVITYLLGVGDRHLDNILITNSGNFFHIDFGFMFGRDPKPLPPAFRLTREMVEGMGGLDSPEYRQFCSLACQAFNSLRKSAGLVLNLLHLMSDAGIEDLSNNPSADAEGVIAKVEQRFRLELTDEQAERYFLGLINDCLSALAPRLMDVFHSIAVARR